MWVLRVLLLLATCTAHGTTSEWTEVRKQHIVNQLRYELPLQVLESTWSPTSSAIAATDQHGEQFLCKPVPLEPTDIVDGEADSEDPLEQLAGMCAELNLGWWTYEWCHKAHIRQFHVSESGVADPVWSLGSFTRRDGFVDHFAGGQHCDETGKGRSTEVVFECCERAQRAFVRLQSITEPSTCHYVATVCTPVACVNDNVDRGSPSNLLRAIESVCFQRSEGWWSYELCYGKAVRQFHEKAAEFILGIAPEDPGQGEMVIGEEPSYQVEYTNGTACDVNGQKRSATVQFECGRVNELLEVAEDFTCHYVVRVKTPAICLHEAFEDPPANPVRCEWVTS